MSLPSVTVAIPVLNEEHDIEACLAAVASQTYPNIIEVLVVDGGSFDRTRERAAAWSRVRVLDNPARFQAPALNLALGAAAGEIFVRVDGHCRIAEDYVERCVESLAATGAAMVGGAIEPDPVGPGSAASEQAVALAMRSRFGVGPARFHRAGGNGAWVDTVYLGAFRTATARAVGGYDGTLRTNEDAELAWRLRSTGGVWFEPSIRSRYRPRRGLKSVAWQFFRYGRGRVTTVARHPSSLAVRQLAAPALMLGLLTPLRRKVASAYLGGLAISTLMLRPRQWRTAALTPVAMATMHLTWAAGFLTGLPAAAGRRRTSRAAPLTEPDAVGENGHRG